MNFISKGWSVIVCVGIISLMMFLIFIEFICSLFVKKKPQVNKF